MLASRQPQQQHSALSPSSHCCISLHHYRTPAWSQSSSIYLVIMPEQQQEEGAVRLGVKVHPPTILVEYIKDVADVKCTPPPQPRNDRNLNQFSRYIPASKLRRKTVRLHNLACSKDSAEDVASTLSRTFPIHFGRGVVNHSQLVSLIAKLQGSLGSSGGMDGAVDHLDHLEHLERRTQRSIDKDPVIIDGTDKKDKKTVGDDVISSETTTRQPREQQQQGRGGVVSDDGGVGGNLLPAIVVATVSGGEESKEGSEDSAAEINSSLGDKSLGDQSLGDQSLGDQSEELGEEEGFDSLIRAIEDDCDDSLRSKAATATTATATATTATTATVAPQAASIDISDGADLNRISEAELAAAKTRMDVMFQRNQLLPGERGYAHDVRKDFGEAEEGCDWDAD